MDPNAALEAILCGHMVADHADALREWLASGGFAPAELLMLADKHPFFAGHCARVYGDAAGLDVRVKADRQGVWTARAEERWLLAVTFGQLANFTDACDECSGTGKVEEQFEPVPGGGMPGDELMGESARAEVRCRSCGGAGRVRA
jgi:hypothetical protein